MGSWIQCVCGNSVHMNIFCGAKISVVVSEDTLDALADEQDASKAIRQILSKSDILVRCQKCHRIAIEEHGSGKLTFLVVETS